MEEKKEAGVRMRKRILMEYSCTCGHTWKKHPFSLKAGAQPCIVKGCKCKNFKAKLMCDICHKEKPDVRYADLLDKWICSDCMGVKEFSEDEERINNDSTNEFKEEF